MVNKHAMEMFV